MSMPAKETEHRLRIIETVNRIGLRADSRQWNGLKRLFVEDVDYDYTSVAGGEAQTLSPEVIVEEMWRPVLEGFTATHHLIGSHAVAFESETAATCVAQVVATHVKSEGGIWQVGGSYTLHLGFMEDRWRICGILFSLVWTTES
jgi:hypothetical protein